MVFFFKCLCPRAAINQSVSRGLHFLLYATPSPDLTVRFAGETGFRTPYNQVLAEQRGDDMSDRVIGILGGMGPEATLDLYRHIIRLTPANKDQDHIRVLIYSNPKIPNRTEAITAGGESPLASLVESARLLEKSGAGAIAIPCNAAHHFLPAIQKKVGVPILNMIEETCHDLCARLPNAKTVGLLASVGTVRCGIYGRALSDAGVELLIPEEADQRRIQIGITQVKAGAHNQVTQEIFQSAAIQLVDAGARAIILGCTEIPLAFNPDRIDYPSLNSTQILAQAAVDWALGKRNI
jgi:aspartate racemase